MAKNGKLVFKNGKIGRFSPSEKNAVLKKYGCFSDWFGCQKLFE